MLKVKVDTHLFGSQLLIADGDRSHAIVQDGTGANEITGNEIFTTEIARRLAIHTHSSNSRTQMKCIAASAVLMCQNSQGLLAQSATSP